MDQISLINETDKAKQNAATLAKSNYLSKQIVFYILFVLILIFFGSQLKINHDIKQHLLNTKKELNNTQKNIQFLQTVVANLNNKLLQQQQLLVNPTDKQQWLFAEVTYLIQLADYNLIYTQDTFTAKALISAADQRLKLLGDPTTSKIRQLLANITTQLDALPKLDIAGLLARIHALQIQATKLPMAQPITTQSHYLNASVKNVPWREALANAWEAWQKLIVIRHHEQPIEPVLPTQQQLYLQQNLQLVLQQAQWAVLHQQPVVYQVSLQQAKDWVQRYFVTTSTETTAMLAAIAELQKINLQMTLPDVTPVLQVLQKITITTQNKGA